MATDPTQCTFKFMFHFMLEAAVFFRIRQFTLCHLKAVTFTVETERRDK